ncbi:hypothetical protein [Anaerovibrio sp.]|nr:hypothetical protein [Anaerovibrio sp.]MDD6597441.1 hypothetical protein [Anaerovibrio sp.]
MADETCCCQPLYKRIVFHSDTMEISINNLAANEGNPFVHTHQ